MDALIREEVELVINSLCFGMIIGVSYDGLRIFRRIFKHKNVFVSIEDYLFWVVWGIIIFVFIFNHNDGVIRGYVFVGMLIGGMLYLKTFSPLLVKYTSLILGKIVTLLLKKPLKMVKMILISLGKHIKKGLNVINGCFKKSFAGGKKYKKHRGECEKVREKKRKKKREEKL